MKIFRNLISGAALLCATTNAFAQEDLKCAEVYHYAKPIFKLLGAPNISSWNIHTEEGMCIARDFAATHPREGGPEVFYKYLAWSGTLDGQNFPSQLTVRAELATQDGVGGFRRIIPGDTNDSTRAVGFKFTARNDASRQIFEMNDFRMELGDKTNSVDLSLKLNGLDWSAFEGDIDFQSYEAQEKIFSNLFLTDLDLRFTNGGTLEKRLENLLGDLNVINSEERERYIKWAQLAPGVLFEGEESFRRDLLKIIENFPGLPGQTFLNVVPSDRKVQNIPDHVVGLHVHSLLAFKLIEPEDDQYIIDNVMAPLYKASFAFRQRPLD